MNPSDEVHLVRIEGLTVKDKEIKRVEDIIRRNDKNVSRYGKTGFETRTIA